MLNGFLEYRVDYKMDLEYTLSGTWTHGEMQAQVEKSTMAIFEKKKFRRRFHLMENTVRFFPFINGHGGRMICRFSFIYKWAGLIWGTWWEINNFARSIAGKPPVDILYDVRFNVVPRENAGGTLMP